MSRIAVLIFALLFQEFAHGARGSEALLVPGKNWELLGEGYQLTADSAVDHAGNIFFTDARNNRIYKVDSGGHIALWKEESGGAHGIGGAEATSGRSTRRRRAVAGAARQRQRHALGRGGGNVAAQAAPSGWRTRRDSPASAATSSAAPAAA